jgi:hypothetical protein
MKIKDWTIFLSGIFMGLFSIVPFSYRNHAEKFQLQNAYWLTATVSEISAVYRRGGEKQEGWHIGLKEYEFKVRIVGEYFNALEHDAFARLVKQNEVVEVLLLKATESGVFEKMNEKLGFKDAAGLKINGTEVLSITKLHNTLGNLYWVNLCCGILMIGTGLFWMYKSTK